MQTVRLGATAINPSSELGYMSDASEKRPDGPQSLRESRRSWRFSRFPTFSAERRFSFFCSIFFDDSLCFSAIVAP